MNLRSVICIFFYVMLCQQTFAQDFAYGMPDSSDLAMKYYDKDSSAHAVVLHEYGKTFISGENKMPLVHQYHVRIKIFDEKAFDKGNITIKLYQIDGDRFEWVHDIKGISYYTDDKGAVKSSELDLKKIYKEKNGRNVLMKFALPNVRAGSIIEYSYITESAFYYNFHDWQFQWDIPKLYSEYEIHLPFFIRYHITLKGDLKVTKTESEIEPDCFVHENLRSDCTRMTYIMTDIPAFVEESYMTAPSNFISALYFEESFYSDSNGTKYGLTKTWKDVDDDFKKNDLFGGQIKRSSQMKNYVSKDVVNIHDTLAKAKAIYKHVQQSFKWNQQYSFFSENGVTKAFEAHSGNSADINLSLIACLAAGGIKTDAVVLSTRDNGTVDKSYPVIDKFNYVIARATIGNKVYLLDATDPLLDFGMLPLRCINDQGRVMSLNKPSYWIDMAQNQTAETTTSLDLTLLADGSVKGSINIVYKNYAAYKIRTEVKKFNSVNEYLENLSEKLPKIQMINAELLNVDSLHLPVVEKLELMMNEKRPDDNDMPFNPAFWSRTMENPFKLTDRSYPVDLGLITYDDLKLTIHYPGNFLIVNKPAPVSLSLPNGGGMFSTDFSITNGIINYTQAQRFTKPVYTPEDYPYLKQFYSKIIQNEQATIVFKKKP